MSRFYRKIPINKIALVGIFQTDYDEVTTPGYEDLVEPERTGIDGIRKVFLPNKYGELSPEVITMSHMCGTSIFVGIVVGAVIHGRQSWLNFMENNQATQFLSHFEAERKLRDVVSVSMGKGAMKWGWKIGAFTSLFIISSTAIAAYRGGPGFFEYVGAGAITGAFFKMNLGLRGMISGSVVGTVFGAVGGALSVSLLYITGLSMQDIQNSQYEIRKYRDKYVRIATAQHYGGQNAEQLKAAIIEEEFPSEAAEPKSEKSSPTPIEKNQ